MATTKNIRLCTDILNSRYTTIADVSSEAAGLPAENILEGPSSLVWRSTSDTNEYVEGDLASAKDVNFVAVIGHNIDPDETATIRVRLSTADDTFATTVTDNTDAETDIIGVIDGPFASVYVLWLPATVSVRYWRIDLSQSANPDTYLEIGRVLIGEYFEPSVQMDLGYSLSFKDQSQLQRTTGNILRVVTKPKQRVVTARLSSVTESEEVDLNKLAVGHECFVSAYPESTSYGELEQQHTVLGLLNANVAMVRSTATTRSFALSILEGSTVGGGTAASVGGASASPFKVSERNLIIGGNFPSWQEGTSIAPDATIREAADLWYCRRQSNQGDWTVTQQSGRTSGRSQYSLRAQRDESSTTTGWYSVSFALEAEDIALLWGSRLTLDFWVQTGANWSTKNDANYPAIALHTNNIGEGSRETVFGVGVTTQTQLLDGTNGMPDLDSGTNAWQRITFAFPDVIAAAEDGLVVEFLNSPVAPDTAGANDWWEFDNVQLLRGAFSSVNVPDFTTDPIAVTALQIARHLRYSETSQTAEFAHSMRATPSVGSGPPYKHDARLG